MTAESHVERTFTSFDHSERRAAGNGTAGELVCMAGTAC
jgi:hypothetical protein